MDASRVVKSNQEQAVASWIDYLNQLRLERLAEAFRSQDINLEDALKSVNAALRRIDIEIIDRNRGGEKGMHGFIAEIAEVGVGNARRLVLGEKANLEWMNDNGPVDLRRHAGDVVVDLQQKFVNAGGKFSLGAIEEHLRKYPDYVDNGGRYQIPRDHYERVKDLLMMSREDASRLSRSDGGVSLKEWSKVHRFFEDTDLCIDDLEPSNLSYAEVQQGAIHDTLSAEKDSLRQTSKERNQQAYQDSLPNLKEGAKATAVAAVLEGGTAFVMAVSARRKEGKALRDFDKGDWDEILKETGKGFGKGGVRGAGVYVLSNYTATPAAVANGLMTASFGIAEQAYKLREGEINEVEFIDNAELICLDVSVSALSSFVGQALIPVPVLGAIVGNTVGTVMYQIAKDALSEREQKIIERYAQKQRELDEKLEAEYGNLLNSLNASMASYLFLLDQAFHPNPVIAFNGSIVLALQLGVSANQVLDSRDKAISYFVD